METQRQVENAPVHRDDWGLSIQDKKLLSMIVKRVDEIGKKLDDLKCALNVRKKNL